MTPNNTLTIFEPANVQTIARLAPQSFNENSLSRTRCLEAGQALLDRVNKEGMNDTLDKEIATFIEKARLTVRKMNGKRNPVTQLFDQIRKAYTSMENDVDPTKADSLSYQLQLHRNAFAKAKHEEEERRRRQEAAKLARQTAIARYRADVEEDYVRQFNLLVSESINKLNALDRDTTLDNYSSTYESLKAFDCNLPEQWCNKVMSQAMIPLELSVNDTQAIQANVMSTLSERFTKQFPFEVESTRDEILDRLPSKKKELERMAKASAEEAAKIKAEIQAREQAEAAQKEAERIEREKQEAAAAKLAAQKQEMDGLFGAPVAARVSYRPKTQVKKKVVIQSPEDIMAIVAFWWSQEGCTKTIEELSKEFKKQISYVNAVANSKDNPTFISALRYEDDVKAK